MFDPREDNASFELVYNEKKRGAWTDTDQEAHYHQLNPDDQIMVIELVVVFLFNNCWNLKRIENLKKPIFGAMKVRRKYDDYSVCDI